MCAAGYSATIKMATYEGQVIEILFDADMWLSPADWAKPVLDASHAVVASHPLFPVPHPYNYPRLFRRLQRTVPGTLPLKHAPARPLGAVMLPPSSFSVLLEARVTCSKPSANLFSRAGFES